MGLERYDNDSLLRVVGEIEDAILDADFHHRLVRIVSDLVPGAIVAFDEINESRGIYQLHHASELSEKEFERLLKKLMILYVQNPVHDYFTNGGKQQVLATLELTTQRQLHKTDFYHEIFKPYGIRKQMVVRLQREQWISTLTINRDASFRDGLPEFLRKLSPFLDRAQRIVGEMERLKGIIAGPCAAVNFTPREIEVFHWMREGKRNREIAMILSCSERTIEKHVHRILEKTGSETRSGAIRSAMGC